MTFAGSDSDFIRIVFFLLCSGHHFLRDFIEQSRTSALVQLDTRRLRRIPCADSSHTIGEFVQSPYSLAPFLNWHQSSSCIIRWPIKIFDAWKWLHAIFSLWIFCSFSFYPRSRSFYLCHSLLHPSSSFGVHNDFFRTFRIVTNHPFSAHESDHYYPIKCNYR